jgi:hypothetical protein
LRRVWCDIAFRSSGLAWAHRLAVHGRLPVQHPARGRAGDCWPISATSRAIASNSPHLRYGCYSHRNGCARLACDADVPRRGIASRQIEPSFPARGKLGRGSYFWPTPLPPFEAGWGVEFLSRTQNFLAKRPSPRIPLKAEHTRKAHICPRTRRRGCGGGVGYPFSAGAFRGTGKYCISSSP